MSTGGGGVLNRYLGGKVPPAHTLLLFKTQSSDFAFFKKTVFFILLPFYVVTVAIYPTGKLLYC